MGRLVLLMGTSGAGKSAVARELGRFGLARPTSLDRLLGARGWPRDRLTLEQLESLYRDLGAEARRLLEQGGDVVVDEWFYLDHCVDWMLAGLGSSRPLPVVAVHLLATLPQLVRRSRSKPCPAPFKTVVEHQRLTLHAPGPFYRSLAPTRVWTDGLSVAEVAGRVWEILSRAGETPAGWTVGKPGCLLDSILHPGSWTLVPEPVLRADPEVPSEGLANAYAPWVMAMTDGGFEMLYGAQGRDGRDRIHRAESRDGFTWAKRGVTVDCGGFRHVNDPSVVELGGVRQLYFSAGGEHCGVYLARERQRGEWEIQRQVLTPWRGRWDGLEIARPSAMVEDGRVTLWYDGKAEEAHGAPRHVGVATSDDGLHFTTHPEPVLDNAGAINVTRVDGLYVLLHEEHDGTWVAVGETPTQFVDRRLLLPAGGVHDRFGHPTPFLFVGNGTVALYLGLASAEKWNRNAIGMATFHPAVR